MSGRTSRDLRKAANEAAGQAKGEIVPAVEAVLSYARSTEAIAKSAVKAAAILSDRVDTLGNRVHELAIAHVLRPRTFLERLRWLILGR